MRVPPVATSFANVFVACDMIAGSMELRACHGCVASLEAMEASGIASMSASEE